MSVTPVSEQSGGPGSILQAEREALGVTLREVSETLNLSISIIEAIEADNYPALPGPVFGRGYVRSYARLLDLDPQPLLARYPRHDAATGIAGSTSEAPAREWVRRRPVLVLGVAVIGLALLAVLAAWWLWPDTGEDRGGIDGEPLAADRTVAEPMGEASDSDWGWVEPGAVGFSAPEESVIDDAPFGPAETAPIDGDAAPGPLAAAGAAPTVEVSSFANASRPGIVRRITAAGDDRLKFRFSADCWVQVRDSAGTDLYSDLGRAGGDLELLGQGPFRIRLGYGPGVSLEFNGEVVPLGPHTRNNMATLVLGQ